MVGNIIESNKVTITGKIISDIQYSHEVYGEEFNYFYMEVSRLSESFDKIPITFSERLISKDKIQIGKNIEVDGQFRSYNNCTGHGSRLVLTVFAREINFWEEELPQKTQNQIFLDGFICKKPIYRSTPFGREITDMLIAVNRPYNKSDYIPCIAWGRNARYSEKLLIGDNIKIWGRIQSRDYQKKFDSGEVENKIAYEVSISKMEVIAKKSEDIS